MVQPFRKVNNSLTTHIVVYVPSTLHTKKVSEGEFKRRITETTRFLNGLFGGATKVEAQGSYLGKGGRLIKESVAKVEGFTSPSEWELKKSKLHAWVGSKKKSWKQEEIAIEYEEDMYWI